MPAGAIGLEGREHARTQDAVAIRFTDGVVARVKARRGFIDSQNAHGGRKAGIECMRPSNAVHEDDLGHIAVRGFSAMTTTFLVRLPAPAGVMCDSCLFKGWQQRTGSGHSRRFPISSLQTSMADYPVQVYNKLKVLLFASSGVTPFESFT